MGKVSLGAVQLFPLKLRDFNISPQLCLWKPGHTWSKLTSTPTARSRLLQLSLLMACAADWVKERKQRCKGRCSAEYKEEEEVLAEAAAQNNNGPCCQGDTASLTSPPSCWVFGPVDRLPKPSAGLSPHTDWCWRAAPHVKSSILCLLRPRHTSHTDRQWERDI